MQTNLLDFPSIADLNEFKDGEEKILFGSDHLNLEFQFQVITTIHEESVSIVAQEKKLFLILEIKDSLRIFRLLSGTLTDGLKIFTFFLD